MVTDTHSYLAIYRAKMARYEPLYHQKMGELAKIERMHADVVVKMDNASRLIEIDQSVRQVLEALSKTTEESVKAYLEPLVTEALQAVFGYNLKFGITFEFERNQVTVQFTLTDEFGNSAAGALEDVKGGGILDVVSIVLQFALVELFALDGPIILDEPGKFVDQTHQATLGQLILSFSERFKRQIVIVTHDDGICAIGTKHYHVTLDGNNISHAELIKGE